MITPFNKKIKKMIIRYIIVFAYFIFTITILVKNIINKLNSQIYFMVTLLKKNIHG